MNLTDLAEKYGLRPHAKKWFSDYISPRGFDGQAVAHLTTGYNQLVSIPNS